MTISERINAQKRYRQKKAAQGIVRSEYQLTASYKAKFDTMAETLAEGWDEPYGIRQRQTKAKQVLFEEMIDEKATTFDALLEENQGLRNEIVALVPKFFKVKNNEQIALPESIAVLPDNPLQLKRLLTKEYQRAQQAEVEAREQKRRAEQYQALYDVANDYNERLQKELGENRELLNGDDGIG